MGTRAPASGISLTNEDAATIKGMLRRGDRQHDIAAYFGVNGGRVAEIATGRRFWWVAPAVPSILPPAGPYPAIRDLVATLTAVQQAKSLIAAAEKKIADQAKA
jgi:hypothetical protein